MFPFWLSLPYLPPPPFFNPKLLVFSSGHDLNRRWLKSDPALHPEIVAMKVLPVFAPFVALQNIYCKAFIMNMSLLRQFAVLFCFCLILITFLNCRTCWTSRLASGH
jgi:hypothetical protein